MNWKPLPSNSPKMGPQEMKNIEGKLRNLGGDRGVNSRLTKVMGRKKGNTGKEYLAM